MTPNAHRAGEMKHTATPWTVFEAEDGGAHVAGITAFEDGRNRLVALIEPKNFEAYSEEDAANAAFIVQAVNAHDDLVAALKAAREWLPERDGGDPDRRDALEMIDAALAKATP